MTNFIPFSGESRAYLVRTSSARRKLAIFEIWVVGDFRDLGCGNPESGFQQENEKKNGHLHNHWVAAMLFKSTH